MTSIRSSQRHATAAELAAEVRGEMKDAWLPNIYSRRIRTMRTRAYAFESLPKQPRVQIQHTLLGVELKTGNRRQLCPDLATARYLSVFARAGCSKVAVPYDITKISHLADELESSWHRMFLFADKRSAGRPEAFRSRLRRMLTGMIRSEIEAVGPGSASPEFNQSTKQRS